MQGVFQHPPRQHRGRAGAGLARRARPAVPRAQARDAVRDQGHPSPAGGRTIVCIASGPSLTADDCQRVGRWKAEATQPQSRIVVVVNEAWRLCAGFADHLYAADGKWWRHITRLGLPCRDELAERFAGRLWTCDIAAARDFGLELLGIRIEPGLNTEAGVVNAGGNNGGMQAVNLAWHLGANRIVLLGYDMQMQGDRVHFHGKHVDKLGDPNPGLLQRWAQAAAPVARDLVELGVEIVNCSRETAAQGWPRRALEDVLSAPPA